MDRFHVIEDAAVILRSKGVFRQVKVYRRGKNLYAAHGSGFIQLYQHGTSHPDVTVVDLEVPHVELKRDALGRMLYEVA